MRFYYLICKFIMKYFILFRRGAIFNYLSPKEALYAVIVW